MRRYSLIYTLTLLSVFASGCLLEEPEPVYIHPLPPATTTGQGIFACYYNGERWIASRGGFISNISVVMIVDGKSFPFTV